MAVDRADLIRGETTTRSIPETLKDRWLESLRIAKNTRLTETEALDLQKKISGFFSPNQKNAWRWDRPWLSNFQLVIHVDGAQEQADVYRAKSDIQAILDAEMLTIKGAKLEVRIEAGKERKQWLTTFFNNVRAFEQASGIDAPKGGLIHLELRTFEVYHVSNPDAAIGKLHRAEWGL